MEQDRITETTDFKHSDAALTDPRLIEATGSYIALLCFAEQLSHLSSVIGGGSGEFVGNLVCISKA